MAQTNHDQHILPRPLAERLTDYFELTEASASAIANAVVDPSEVRASISGADYPDVEPIPVPGGTLLGVRTSVWARRTMPDPRNPRTLPSRRHPFAVEPGTGGEDSKFRPVPEPRPLDPERPQSAELAVDIESSHHLAWASQQAARFATQQFTTCSASAPPTSPMTTRTPSSGPIFAG
jgi:hypothetical protein